MAISMVRKPSETPNITNIDDIIPFRYAYGNQNGYVIGKGTELSYTINANTFRINSGRVVLQGVESDIDANGIELVIDIASETRYYVAYYQVNLATNSTNILLSNYDTAGYPMIDLGDDLTVNSSGIARLPIYRFSVSNGVIGNVEKVVKEIQYIQRDENGILKMGDLIIPQKKLLWSSDVGSNNINLVINTDKNLEFTVSIPQADGSVSYLPFTFKGKMMTNVINALYDGTITTIMITVGTQFVSVQLNLISLNDESLTYIDGCKIYKIYEIIE